MPREAERRTRAAFSGFTLLELVIVIVLVGVLTGAAALRLRALRAEAERAALAQVVGGLQAAVSLEMLTLITRGRDAELAALAGSNPMLLLVEPPGSYLGAFDAPNPAAIAPGRWYFERERGLLVYRVRYAEGFESELPGPPRAAFRVEIVFDDRNGDGRYQADVDGTGGARLVPVAAYGWRS